MGKEFFLLTGKGIPRRMIFRTNILLSLSIAGISDELHHHQEKYLASRKIALWAMRLSKDRIVWMSNDSSGERLVNLSIELHQSVT